MKSFREFISEKENLKEQKENWLSWPRSFAEIRDDGNKTIDVFKT